MNAKTENEAKPKRAPVGPRPAYIMLSGDNAKAFADEIANGTITIDGATRKADEVLDAVANGKTDAYVRFVIK